MAVYGQEYKAIDFSKGLYIKETSDAMPDGYCSSLLNMHININGEAEIRPNFIPTSAQGTTGVLDSNITRTVSSVPAGEYFCSLYHKAYGLNPVGINDPLVVMTSQTTAPDGVVRWLKRDGLTGQSFNMSALTFPRELVQYRDRYYSLTVTGVDVSRWTFNASTITVTSLQTFPGTEFLNSMVAFRDRLFASGANRLYFTDLPISGGYPENWNGANNFISMPALGATIVNMLVHNDRIFIFTTEGVYQLYAIGDPTNWSISLISTNVKVYSKNSVALVRDTFVYTDYNQVYMFNGVSSRPVGDPIKEAMKTDGYFLAANDSYVAQPGATGTRIIPYQDGFILAITTAEVSGGNWIEVTLPKYFYFDGATWSEIDFGGDTGVDIHFALINVIQDKGARVFTNESPRETDIIVELRSTSLGPITYSVVMHSVRKSNTWTDLALFKPFYTLLITKQTDVQPTAYILARVHEVVLNLKNALREISYEVRTDKIGGEGAIAITTAADAVGRNMVDVIRVRNAIERTATLQVRIRAYMINTTYSQVNQPFPSVRINSIMAKINTDTRQIPDRDFRI